MKLHEIKHLSEGHLYSEEDFTHLKSRAEIVKFINDHSSNRVDPKHITVEPNGTVNISRPAGVGFTRSINFGKNGHVQFHKIPIKFGQISGYSLDISSLGLHTLENCPRKILNGSFDATGNKILNLKGGPEYVDGSYSASECRLNSLEGSPDYVGDDFDVSSNDLKSLKGCPRSIGNNFDFERNYIKELDCHQVLVNGRICFYDNPIKNIDNITEAFTDDLVDITFGGKKVEYSLLPLLSFPRFNFDKDSAVGKIPTKVWKILKKHAGKPDEIFECQQELIDAGYEVYA